MSDQQQKARAMAPGAMGSLIMGIISLCTSYIFVGIIFAIIGMVLGGKAKKAIAADPQAYRAPGIAKAGHIISIIGLPVSIIFSILFVVYIVVLVGAGVANYMN
jgi:hypothetical protein